MAWSFQLRNRLTLFRTTFGNFSSWPLVLRIWSPVAKDPLFFTKFHGALVAWSSCDLSNVCFYWAAEAMLGDPTVLLVGGWAYPSEKYDFVSWDDDIPNRWKNKIHVPNHQPGTVWIYRDNHDTQISHAHLQPTSVIYTNHQISTFHWPSPCWSIFYHQKKSHRSAIAVNTFKKNNMWSLVWKRALVISAQSQARMSCPGPTKLAP